MDTAHDPSFERATFARIAWRLIPLLFAGYVACFLDRVNIGFAKLQMAGDLQFSDAIYGFGAGVFFIGYFLFEVPSNLALTKIGARKWMARIMVSWGLISAGFVFVDDVPWGPISAAFGCTDAEFTFYLLRFLLGATEAGFFPGVILYLTFWFPGDRRAKVVALFMAGIAVSNVIGSPLSGAILQFADGYSGLRGWEWLFILEALPSVVLGALFLAVLPDGPDKARWLTDAQREIVAERLASEEASKVGGRHTVGSVFTDWRVWAFAAVYFCTIVCLYAVNFWMPTIVQEMGIDPDAYLEVGLVTMIPWGVMVIAQVAWAHHSDRTGERRWHCIAGLLAALAGMVLLAVASHAVALSLVGLTLATAGTGCALVTFWSLPPMILSGAAAAAGIAWINSVGNLGGYLGPDVMGRVRDASGGDATAAFLLLGGLALVGIVVLLALPVGRRAAAS